MDTVEHFAKISIYTKVLGREQLLSSEDVEKLWVQRQKYFGLESADQARPKDAMCPVTDGRSGSVVSAGASEAISMSRADLIDLINEVVTSLER
jgi:hypothetical protein